MSLHSHTSLASRKGKTRRDRCLSPSQIAQNLAEYEIWSAYQNCEEVDMASDLPTDLHSHTNNVFRLAGQLPLAWMMEKSKIHRRVARVVTDDFLDFLRAAHASAPTLYSAEVSYDDEAKSILRDLNTVFVAWDRAKKMRKSTQKFSEADYAAKVYGLVRTAAVEFSVERVQHAISLPQPVPTHTIRADAVRTLNAKVARPDGALFIPTHYLAELCKSEQSPYKVLCRSVRRRSGTVGGESSFRYQSTVCARLPQTRVFEIASTFWEDKKPSQDDLHVAYRQNRMATTAALRQLHALNVRAPVFGMVWAEGKVRAHVDWWEVKNGEIVSMIYSAAYGGSGTKDERRRSAACYEWDLAEPADIIQVYLLMRNLDRWTTGPFCEAVIAGVKDLARRVQAGQLTVMPWRRSGDLVRLVGRKVGHPEFTSAASLSASSAAAAPVKRKVKKRKPCPSASRSQRPITE
ncbi:hypothetical protein BD414DRAFT_419862 [Trametes punicea]|nr:hypothetical protein BD414DRAFT_419862 [Trametes punicea]